MSLKLAAVACLTALMMAIGQIMFKVGANKITSSESAFFLSVVRSPTLISACFLYAATIFLWIWVLKHAPLSKAYPYTAMAYIFTPLLSLWYLNEIISMKAILGYGLIVCGVLLSTSVSSHAIN